MNVQERSQRWARKTRIGKKGVMAVVLCLMGATTLNLIAQENGSKTLEWNFQYGVPTFHNHAGGLFRTADADTRASTASLYLGYFVDDKLSLGLEAGEYTFDQKTEETSAYAYFIGLGIRAHAPLSDRLEAWEGITLGAISSHSHYSWAGTDYKPSRWGMYGAVAVGLNVKITEQVSLGLSYDVKIGTLLGEDVETPAGLPWTQQNLMTASGLKLHATFTF
ncbi:MAG: outer membrane beta-barrel protein [Bacteroidales bacterium]|nr:outer membrane beta-barrel protein [Bacteroidales bacterium]